MRLIVCGGRRYADREFLFRALDLAHKACSVELLIHGDGDGADQLADEWAKERGIDRLPFPAAWAGHNRNQEMMDVGKPDHVIAFPGVRSTADMVKIAKSAGLAPWKPTLLMLDILDELEKLYAFSEQGVWWVSPQTAFGGLSAEQLYSAGRGLEILNVLRGINDCVYV